MFRKDSLSLFSSQSVKQQPRRQEARAVARGELFKIVLLQSEDVLDTEKPGKVASM